ncbi:MAG: DUF4835 family protein [Bacteroidales bacterium]|jgi:hypothetical protein|nr:DUF4835 family protein [Paludibacteraceae bacterium]MDD5997850.1 DUF4835 family protein [Bacteroidales bacterium]MBP5526695.1 DUF4835 family protein [Paludibacteraceae bacterium]MBQ6561111.1 DUF4835 family protein [Paludibacteraceae bacterium]MBQ8019824.1 DUF4835 family protein [Paludibacteraceae bacterium]
MKKVFLTLVSFVLGSVVSMAQELNCSITVNADNVPGTSKDMYKDLESALADFFNTHKWTDAVFQKEERIDVTFTLYIDQSSEANGGKQTGMLSVTASRPVFNTSYTTPLFNYQDNNFTFNYNPGDRIDYSEGDYDVSQNLMAVLAFYVNIVLGLEFDSFSPLGGTSFFEKAEMISAAARSSDDEGWKAFAKNDNRYSLISLYMDANMANLRNVYYEYHRLGLDVMADDLNKGKAKIMEQMTYLREMQRAKPFAVPLQIFVNTKFDELYNLYRLDDQKVRDEVYNAVAAIAPQMKDIDKLQKGN